MKISLYPSVNSQSPLLCDWDTFLSYTQSKSLQMLAAEIVKAVKAGDRNKKDELKKKLPVITWQAWFDKARKNAEAHPNGLFMLDVDHLKEPPETVYAQKIAGKIDLLGIVAVHKTISCQGLRVVAFLNPNLKTLAENQRWLARNLMLENDEACKDWARSSFIVPFDYFMYLKAEIFNPGFTASFVLKNESPAESPKIDYDAAAHEIVDGNTNQRQYKGIDLYDIAMRWLDFENAGVPQEGERNTVLYRLATRMKYITDFNPHVIANNIPHCGLSDEEVMQLCTSACGGQRTLKMPEDLKQVIESFAAKKEEEATTEEPPVIKLDTLPPLPPIFEQYVRIAPDDFKQAVILCLLPMLGTLGSRLRAQYINGKFETPSFMVALEAPQASGKSFIEDVSAMVMTPIKQKDEQERAKEQEFDEQIKKMKTAGTGTKAERAEVRELLENKPTPIIRFMPATASITKLLIRMDNAQGLHLFAMAVEVDTVAKAFKRGFSNLSDLLRCAFDNSEFGQEYATDTSYSGKVRIYYNTLYSGTPAAMRHFYNNSEDGTMSRTLFVTLPDQFGKQMPIWDKFTDAELNAVSDNVMLLYNSSIVGDEIQNPYVMNLSFLNERIEQWIEEQRQLSVKFSDRTRNIFYRRCAEVAFRAGMLAWYLYVEMESKKKAVCDFAIWVADMMLAQFLVRINISNDDVELGNLFAKQVYIELDSEFNRSQLEAKLKEHGFRTVAKKCIYMWRQAGVIRSETRYGADLFIKCRKNGNENKVQG